LPDYLRDLAGVILASGKPGLKRDRLLKQVEKMGRKWKERGVPVERITQRQFCEVLAESAQLFVQTGEMDEPNSSPREWMMKLCVSRLSRGDFSDWTGWEYRNEWAMGSYSPEIPNKRWRLEPVESLAVLGEQGIGDEVMFGSCLPEALQRVPEVVYECDPRLVEIFARSMPGLKTKPRNDILAKGQELVKYLTLPREEDAFIPVGDLPRLFRKSRASFPGESFLKPLPEYVDKWKVFRGRVGLAYRSRTGQLPVRDFGISRPVILQYDFWDADLEGTDAEVPECDLRDGIEDILGICANLERVVSVPQTVVHLAGAIGARVDVVLPPKGSSRILDQFRYRYIQPMPWYRSVSVFQNLNEYRLHRRARS